MPSTLTLIKLIIVVGIPLWLIATKRQQGLLLWIGITLGTELLNVTIIASLTPLNVVGLLYLPMALKSIPVLLDVRSGRLVILSFLLLLLLGFIYGFIFPWPDTTLLRSFNQLAEGRSVIYLARTLADLSVAVLVARTIQSSQTNVLNLLRYILIGTTLAALGTLIEWIIGRDLLTLLSPELRHIDPVFIGRYRGINGEPRVAGQLCAWGILLLLGLPGLSRISRATLVTLHVLGFALTVSTTALVVLAMGLTTLIFFSHLNRANKVSLTVLLLVLIVFARVGLESQILVNWNTNVVSRIERAQNWGEPQNIGEAIADRLEVFDASAVLFFWSNPEYLLFGAGPGLISLPASDYIPTYARAIYGDRIDSVPHMGLVQLVADSGIIGFTLWIAIALVCYRDIRKLEEISSEREVWRITATYFLLFSVLYLLQSRYVWYLYLGMAIGSSLRLQDMLSRHLVLFRNINGTFVGNRVR